MKELEIIVCAKQIPDPEAPLSDVKVDAQKKKLSLMHRRSSALLTRMP